MPTVIIKGGPRDGVYRFEAWETFEQVSIFDPERAMAMVFLGMAPGESTRGAGPAACAASSSNPRAQVHLYEVESLETVDGDEVVNVTYRGLSDQGDTGP